jgi:hypothetical protein
MDAEKDVVQEARDWIRQRDDYKKRLLVELEQAKMRVSEIETTLVDLGAVSKPAVAAAIPVVDEAVRRAAHAAILASGKVSLSDLAIDVVTRHPDGISSGQIVKAIQAVRPNAKPGVLYPAVYRARDQGRLVEHKKKYFLPKVKEAAE